MLSVILSWAFVFFASLFWGRWLVQKMDLLLGGKSGLPPLIYFWVGLAFFSFGLSLLSFFIPLSPFLKASIWIFLLAKPIFYGWKNRNALFKQVKERALQYPVWVWLPFLFTGLVSLFKAAGVPEIFDEGAYHLPLIRMWEQKAMVPGFANLNGHFGLNSSWHLLSAFSNLNFLPFQDPTFSLNGLVGMVVGLASSVSMGKIFQKQAGIRQWIQLFLPFFIFRNLLSSPSTDIPAIACTWFIWTAWLENYQNRESPWKIWPIFSILATWVFTIKASSGPLLMLPAGIFFLALAEFEWKKAFFLFGFGFCLVFPWLVQNWLLSGYLIFPIESTAFLLPEWQVPVLFIKKKFYLEQFGAFAPPAHYSMAWFKSWFAAHNADTRIILVLGFLGLVFSFGLITFRKKNHNPIAFYFFGTCLATIMAWFLTITEPRYGFGTLVVMALFPLAFLADLFSKKVPLLKYFAFLPLFSQGLMLAKTIKEPSFEKLQIWSAVARPAVGYRPIQMKNFSAHLPETYLSPVPARRPVFCWDCPFPCFPLENKDDSSLVGRKVFWGKEVFISLPPSP
jgi:hypothetical protein